MPATKKTLVVGAFAAALAGGAVFGATLGVPALSSAQSPGSTVPTTTAPSSPGSGDLNGFAHDGPGGHGPNGETELTGADADKAKAAALAAVPGGTVRRVSKDTDGASGATFEAHVTKSDGSEVEVQLDQDFKVLSVNAGHGPGGPGGPGHHGFGGPGGRPDEAALTGADADKAKAAALAAVPGGTVEGVSKEAAGDTTNGGAFEAHVTKADGSEAEVQLDKDFKVLAVAAGHGPGGHGPGDRPGQ